MKTSLRVSTFAFLMLALSLSMTAVPITAESGKTILHVGRMIDGKSDTALEKKSIVVADGKIVDIADGYVGGEDGDLMIDLKGSTVMPGLMDMHTHLTNQGSKTSYAEGPRLNPGAYSIRSVVYAERTLMAGFTTVRDLGDRFNLSIPLRNAINSGFIPGPRIFTAAGSLATTGGHGDGSNGLRADLQGDPGPKEGVVNSVEDAKKAVRQRYKDGADLIKITATGGVLSLAKNGQNPQFTEDEVRAVVEMANDYGFIVAAHAHGAEGMKRAIRAGVTSIEHGTYMDDEAIELFKKHGTYFVPTILAGRFVAEKAAIEGYFPAVVRPKAAAIGPLIQDTFARAFKRGVKIAFGTDSGVSPHGQNALEFEYMVEAGMPPMEAIRSATVTTAEMLGIDDRLGSLEVGKIADIVAVDGDPLADIKLLQNVSFVMKAGLLYKQNGAIHKQN